MPASILAAGEQVDRERDDPGQRDDHERGRDRAPEADVEPQRQHRHDHEPAADAEEAGQRADAKPATSTVHERRPRALAVVVAGPRRARCHVANDASSITGTKSSTSSSGPTVSLAERAEQRPRRGRRCERKRDPPAHLAAAGERARADRGGHRDDDQRPRRGRTDRLPEHVDEDREREDRAAPADRADDEPDRRARARRR